MDLKYNANCEDVIKDSKLTLDGFDFLIFYKKCIETKKS